MICIQPSFLPGKGLEEPTSEAGDSQSVLVKVPEKYTYGFTMQISL